MYDEVGVNIMGYTKLEISNFYHYIHYITNLAAIRISNGRNNASVKYRVLKYDNNV
jgi:hypothetical protein